MHCKLFDFANNNCFQKNYGSEVWKGPSPLPSIMKFNNTCTRISTKTETFHRQEKCQTNVHRMIFALKLSQGLCIFNCYPFFLVQFYTKMTQCEILYAIFRTHMYYIQLNNAHSEINMQKFTQKQQQAELMHQLYTAVQHTQTVWREEKVEHAYFVSITQLVLSV